MMEGTGVMYTTCWNKDPVLIHIIDTCPCLYCPSTCRLQQNCCADTPTMDLSYWAFDVSVGQKDGRRAVNAADRADGESLPVAPLVCRSSPTPRMASSALSGAPSTAPLASPWTCARGPRRGPCAMCTLISPTGGRGIRGKIPRRT